MQRETCRLQPGTPRRTVHSLRATLLSHFPIKAPAELGLGGGHTPCCRGEGGNRRISGPAAPAQSWGAFRGPATAAWTPLSASTPFFPPDGSLQPSWLPAAAPHAVKKAHPALPPTPNSLLPSPSSLLHPPLSPPNPVRPSWQDFSDFPPQLGSVLLPLLPVL